MASVLLIRPASFAYNEQTANSNSFQNRVDSSDLSALAASEFDAAVRTLSNASIDVKVFNDTADPVKPDAIFPNNWVSFHPDGTAILYPMAAPNRRLERRTDILEKLSEEFRLDQVNDLSASESEGRFLEGTGSIVFDHVNRIAYACRSIRTDAELFISLANELGYKPVLYTAKDKHGMQVYHTNVVMCVGSGYSVACLESVSDEKERSLLQASLAQAGELVEISLAQMERFCGNMLEIINEHGKKILVISGTAFKALTNEQLSVLERFASLLPVEIPTIERIGGGSARCMIAEIFLPKRS